MDAETARKTFELNNNVKVSAQKLISYEDFMFDNGIRL